ncbi:MAG: hypothetical protein WC992_07465, partial [Acholeplasmataceae bacterium]
MKEIVIKDHEIQGKLPKDFEYVNHQLIIPKNTHYEDPIKVTIQDDNNETLEIIVSENTSIKIILELASIETLPQSYRLTLTAKQNAQVKYLLVSELASKAGLVEHYFTADRDA